MTVAVVARVNRHIDYAQLYTTAQAKLDIKDEAISQLQVGIDSFFERHYHPVSYYRVNTL